MTPETNSTEAEPATHAEPRTFSGMNPFILALAWIWTIAFVLAGVLALIASQSYDETAAVQFLWASIFSSISFLALLTWLLTCALTWKPAPKS